MSDTPRAPRFSVVIPTRNRPEALSRLLQSLDAQAFPRDQFEILVVDDAGDVDLEPIVAPHADRGRVVLLHRQSRLGCAGARQAGIERATGEYLAFTDDDCEPCRDWLSHLNRAATRQPNVGLGGQTENADPSDPYAETSQLVVNQFAANRRDAFGHPLFFPTCNVAFPREAFRAAGGLDVDWTISGGEDRDLCRRWVRAGHRMAFVPEARVAHRQEMCRRRFWRQHFSYGRGAAKHLRLNGASPEFGIVHRLGLQPTILRECLRGRLARDSWRLAGLALVSQTATSLGFCYELLRASWASREPVGPWRPVGQTKPASR